MNKHLSNLSSQILAEIIDLQKKVAQAGLDLNVVMQSIVDGIQSILPFEGTVIEMLEGDSMVYKAVSGTIAQGTLGIKVKANSSLSGLSVKKGESLRCDDSETDHRVDRESCRKISVRSMIVVPFKTSGGTFGVLKVMSSRTKAFNPQDEIIISLLADSLAASFQNAEIAEQRKEKSMSLHQQKDFLSALFENLSDGVLACDAKGKLTLFNRKLREWYGLPASCLSSDIPTLINTKDFPLDRVLDGKEVKNFELSIAPKAQDTKILLAFGEAVYDQKKNLIGAVIVAHDITEQKRAQEENLRLKVELEKKVKERTLQLSKALEELKASTVDLQLKSDVLENSLNAFDIVNSKGEFIYANKTYLKMWGYNSVEEVLGSSPASHCADPSIPKKIITELKNTGECDIKFLAKRKDGTTFDVHMWARLAHDAQGNEIYPTTTVDITEAKRYESELREAIRSRDEFLSIASHELKTPLTSLKLLAQMRLRNLEKNPAEAFSREKLSTQFQNDNKQLNRLSRLVDDMLDITRINSGKLTIQLEEFNLTEMAKEVVERYKEQIELTESQIEFEGEENVTGTWDKLRIEQIISNLLTNSVKYGGGKPVVLKVFKDKEAAKIVIRDNGMGIAAENHERIFQRFERAVPKREISGLGLGLYIAKEIVERHSGKIIVESEPGKGASFTVSLPLHPGAQ